MRAGGEAEERAEREKSARADESLNDLLLYTQVSDRQHVWCPAAKINTRKHDCKRLSASAETTHTGMYLAAEAAFKTERTKLKARLIALIHSVMMKPGAHFLLFKTRT